MQLTYCTHDSVLNLSFFFQTVIIFMYFYHTIMCCIITYMCRYLSMSNRIISTIMRHRIKKATKTQKDSMLISKLSIEYMFKMLLN